MITYNLAWDTSPNTWNVIKYLTKDDYRLKYSETISRYKVKEIETFYFFTNQCLVLI